MNVVIIGASDKPERYSYRALMMLGQKGHRVFPVHPRLGAIEGIKVFSSCSMIREPVDTVTLYVGPLTMTPALIDEILVLRPRRIIVNPGTENSDFEGKAQQAGIKVVRGCTLVMLSTGQF